MSTQKRNIAPETLRRPAAILIGLFTLILGVLFYRKGWPLAPFFSPLLVVLGAQITLWALGVSSELIGNVPHSLVDLTGKLKPTEPFLGNREDWRERNHALEERRATMELLREEMLFNREEELHSLGGSVELLERRKGLEFEEAQRWRKSNGLIRYHLTIAIGLLKYVKDSDSYSRSEAIENAFRLEIEEIKRLLSENSEQIDQRYGLFKDFVEASVIFCFEPIQSSTEKLFILSDLNEKLKRGW